MNNIFKISLVVISFVTIIFLTKKYFKTISKMILNEEQEYFISDLHPTVKDRFRNFINKVQSIGWQVIITSGYRSFSKQAELKKENKSNGSPGYSEHNYGFAIDLNLINKSGEILKKKTEKEKWIKSGVPKIAKELGFVWGGEKFANYYDPVHFFIDVDTTKLLALAKKQFGNNVDEIKGNEVIIT